MLRGGLLHLVRQEDGEGFGQFGGDVEVVVNEEAIEESLVELPGKSGLVRRCWNRGSGRTLSPGCDEHGRPIWLRRSRAPAGEDGASIGTNLVRALTNSGYACKLAGDRRRSARSEHRTSTGPAGPRSSRRRRARTHPGASRAQARIRVQLRSEVTKRPEVREDGGLSVDVAGRRVFWTVMSSSCARRSSTFLRHCCAVGARS